MVLWKRHWEHRVIIGEKNEVKSKEYLLPTHGQKTEIDHSIWKSYCHLSEGKYFSFLLKISTFHQYQTCYCYTFFSQNPIPSNGSWGKAAHLE
jgi:hypothetical protein